MINKISICLCLLFAAVTLSAQDSSAIANFESTTQGILIPRMLESERILIASPATGLLVYQTDGDAGFYFNYGNSGNPNWMLLGDDADNDPTNEIETWSTLDGIPAGFADTIDHVDDADNDPTNEIETWSTLDGIPVGFADTIDHVDDADNDPTNEIETWSTLGGIPAGFADTIDNVDDADNDPTNEIELPLGGTSGQILETDGMGNVSWQDAEALVVSDRDGDTKIQVEQFLDEDIIRFDLGGTEYFQMDGPRLHVFNSGSSVFIGRAGLMDDLSNNGNVGIGSQALANNVTSSNNVAISFQALSQLITGGGNVAVGPRSGNQLMNGSLNVAIGNSALSQSSSSSSNVALGPYAGYQLTQGDNNTIIGGGFSTDLYSQSGAVKIGHRAGQADSTDNVLHIANTSSKSLIYGNFSSDYLQINGELNIDNEYSFPITDGSNGQVLTSNGSGDLTWTTPAELPSGGLNGQFLKTDGAGTTSWSDIVLDTDLGIGTPNPISEVHVVGNDRHSRLTLAPFTTSSGDSSSVFFAEDHDASFGMSILYDGAANNMQILGHSNSIIYGPHVTIERNSGETTISSYTALGEDAPKIKMKKYTMTTPASQGTTTSILHGLDADKILSIDAIVTASTLRIPPGQRDIPGYEYNIYTNSTQIYFRNVSSNSASILNAPVRILITYEE